MDQDAFLSKAASLAWSTHTSWHQGNMTIRRHRSKSGSVHSGTCHQASIKVVNRSLSVSPSRSTAIIG
eukprot:821940-Amphidinium_carterae.1